MPTTVLDIDSDRVELLRKLGLKVYYGDATRHDLLHAAGAEQARMIVIALDTPERTLDLVHTVKRHYPHLKVLARAFDTDDAHELLEAGAENVYRESLDSSLRMGRDALHHLGFRAHQATRATQTFLKHEENALRELGEARKDRAGYISATRRKIEELERILQSDLKGAELNRDAGWDPESLRDEVRARFGQPPTGTAAAGATD